MEDSQYNKERGCGEMEVRDDWGGDKDDGRGDKELGEA